MALGIEWTPVLAKKNVCVCPASERVFCEVCVDTQHVMLSKFGFLEPAQRWVIAVQVCPCPFLQAPSPSSPSHRGFPQYSGQMQIQSSLVQNAITVLSLLFVSLHRGNSMPRQQYWRTGKMKVSSLESGLLSRAESSRRTLQR